MQSPLSRPDVNLVTGFLWITSQNRKMQDSSPLSSSATGLSMAPSGLIASFPPASRKEFSVHTVLYLAELEGACLPVVIQCRFFLNPTDCRFNAIGACNRQDDQGDGQWRRLLSITTRISTLPSADAQPSTLPDSDPQRPCSRSPEPHLAPSFELIPVL